MATNHEPIELPVLFIPEEDLALYNVVPDSVTPENRPMMFYAINAISPLIDNGNECTEIWVNGETVVCPIPYEKVKNMIKWK